MGIHLMPTFSNFRCVTCLMQNRIDDRSFVITVLATPTPPPPVITSTLFIPKPNNVEFYKVKN